MKRWLKSLHLSHLEGRRRSPRPSSTRLHLEQLEDRRLLSGGPDFSLVKAKLPALLDHLQSAVTQTVLADRMPLAGSGLQNSNPAKLLSAIGSAVGPALPASPNATANDVQTALFNTLTGMKLFPAGSTKDNGVQVVQQGPNDYEFKLHLASQSPVVVNEPFDLGLPGTTFTATGNVQVQLTYQIELDFGVALQNGQTHLYLDTGPSPEVTLSVDVTMPNSSLTGKLGPLGLNVYDGKFPAQKAWTTSPTMTPSEFKGKFTLDVTGPDATHHLDAAAATPAYFLQHTTVNLGGSAAVNLAAELTVNDFPAMALNLQVQWPFDNGKLLGSRPTVSFNDVQLDVGTLFQALSKPLGKLNQALTPVNTIVASLTQPLPVISDLAGGSVGLLDLGKVVDPSLAALDPFVTAFKRLYALSTPQNIPVIAPGTVLIDYGSFDLGNADPRDPGFQLGQVTPHVTAAKPTAKAQLQASAAPGAQTALAYIYDPQTGLEGSELGALQLPFLDDAATAFGALTLHKVTLIQYTMPSLDSMSNGQSLFHIDQEFPVLGPIDVRIHGDIQAKAHLTFGYDTYGLINLGKPNPIVGQPPVSALDGFFIADTGASLAGSFAGDLSLNVPVFEPYVGGGVSAVLNLSLAPPPPGMDHVRFSQLQKEASFNPLTMFTMPAGKVDGFLEAGVRIGIELPIIGFVGVDFSTEIASETLLDFDYVPTQVQPPVLAHRDPNDHSVLVLNLGQFEAQRLLQTSDTKELFEVAHHPGASAAGDETVDVTAYDTLQTFDHVKRIVAKGSNNDETILFDAGLLDAAQVDTGDGTNVLSYLGKGSATFNAGKGKNSMTGGAGFNSFHVTGDGDNTLIGGTGTNDLGVTGNGKNRLVAGGGNDKLSVKGDGANTFTAGPGQDSIAITGSGNSTKWNTLSWAVGDGNLTIVAFRSNNALEVAGTPNADAFTVNPYPVPGAGVQVIADGATVTANGWVQKVSIDGGPGADTTTVNDLGSDSMVQEVGVNLGEALDADGAHDVTTVNGNPTTHAVTVGTDSAWLHPAVHKDQADGGVMFVRTRPGYKVDVAVVNNEDDLIVNAKGAQNQINVQSNTGHTVINADAGGDSFVVGSDNSPNKGRLYYVPPSPASPSLLFGLRGVLDLHAGPGANALTLIDSQDTGPSHLTLTDSAITGWVGQPDQPVVINYGAVPAGNFSGGLALKTGKGKDTLLVTSTPAGAPVKLITGGGGDQVSIGNSADTLNSIGGPVTLDGGDGTPTVTIKDDGAAVSRDYLLTKILGAHYLIAKNATGPADARAFVYQNLGALVVNGGNHGNTATVRDTGCAVVLHTGDGADSVLVGDPTNGNHVVITGSLTVDGQGGNNQLTVNDQGTAQAMLAYTLDAGKLQRSGAGPINYSHVQQMTLNGGNGVNNLVAVLGTAAGTAYQVNAGAGNAATINLGSAATPLDPFKGDLTIDGQGGVKTLRVVDTAAPASQHYTLTVGRFDRGSTTIAHYQHVNSVSFWAGSGGNVIDVPSTPAGLMTQVFAGGGPDAVHVGTGGAGSTIDAIQGPLTVMGQPGHGTTLLIDDPGHLPSPARSYQVTAAQVTRTGPPVAVAPIGYAGLATLTLIGSGQTYKVLSTAAATTTRVVTGPGDDAIQVGDGNTLSGVQGPVVIDGQAGTNQLVFTDPGNAAGRDFTVAAGGVSGSNMGKVVYAGVQAVEVDGGAGVNTFHADATAAGTPVVLKGGGGANTLYGPATDATWDVAKLNGGTLQGPSLLSPVSFSGMKNLHGGAGSDVFAFHKGVGLGGNLDGGGGSDTLDYSGYMGDVIVNLLLHKATGVGGQVANVENVLGSVGNDILVGGGQHGLLRGGQGRNLIIAGTAGSQLFAGGDDSILIAGFTAYDANQAALDKIMAEWTLNTPAGERRHNLVVGGGLNGAFRLYAATVKSNQQVNTLSNGAGTDWLFLRSGVDKSNSQPSDFVTPL